MIYETMLSQLLILCARATIVRKWINADPTSWSEYSGYLDVFWIHQFDKVLHDDIDTIFMEVSMISETEKIDLETLAFHHLHIGNVLYLYLGKVRLTSNWT